MNQYILDVRTANPHFPGIGRYTTNLTRALAALLTTDEQLSLVATPNQQADWGAFIANYTTASPFSLQQQWQIPALLKQIRQTQNPKFLYHSPYYLMPYAPGLPTVLTFYDIIPIRFPEYSSLQARLLFRVTTRLACRAARQIVAISEAARRDLIEQFAVAPEKVTTTPLAPDPHFAPQPVEKIAELRTRYNLPEEYLLYFGINKPHKNLVKLIEAFQRYLLLTTRNVQLVIAGAWDERYPESKQRVEALNLQNRVRFLGRVADVDLSTLYSGARAFFFPSHYEGFGLPVLEAMACGTPVACSNTSSLPEAAGEAALFFDPNDVAAIADAMWRLLDDAELHVSLRQRGLAQAQKFTWRHTAQLTLDVYRQICA